MFVYNWYNQIGLPVIIHANIIINKSGSFKLIRSLYVREAFITYRQQAAKAQTSLRIRAL